MTQGAALEAGIVDHLWFAADPQPAISALASYQNDDGGFGKGLELDIESPASNPFATWMGLIYLRSLPATVTEHIRMKAAAWLSENQAADGDWHLSEETRSRGLAPWLTTWTFPSLMPSCCLAGQAAALGIASPRMLDRVDALFVSRRRWTRFETESSTNSRPTRTTRSPDACQRSTSPSSFRRSCAGRERTALPTLKPSSTLRCAAPPNWRLAFQTRSPTSTYSAP